ncbi:glycosyltransferase [Streptomyces sp. NPDC048282]|uniref:glycosyltransferase n=1 Tax=Streptomyces sp. NPDC048282 TaxID=3365528 RepID=UPI00371D9906
MVVTRGSFDNRDPGRLIRPAVDGPAGRDVLVVAATGRADGPAEIEAAGPVPANARIGGYVPFDALLPHASVLVTNGGYGGVHQALRHGVPLVVGGDGEDKPEVAARVEWSGTGVDLRTGQPSPEAVRDAVAKVLGEPGTANGRPRCGRRSSGMTPSRRSRRWSPGRRSPPSGPGLGPRPDGGRGTPHEAAGPRRRGARAPDHRRIRHPGDGNRTRRGHPMKTA